METKNLARKWLIYLTEAGLFSERDRKEIYQKLLEGYPIETVLPHTKALDRFYRHHPMAFYDELYDREQIKVLTLYDEDYPLLLKEFFYSPLVLFLQGQSRFLDQRSLAVVGSRKLTAYGQKMIRQLFTKEVCQKFVLVSGLAKGADRAVHEQAIEQDGRTIAIIGTGLGHTYPFENRLLQEKIRKEQLLISPFPYFTGVERWHFPYRNQIIAGLTEGTVVIEAQKRSGSLITANYALQGNREVYALPGRIDDEFSIGCNELLQLGAGLLLRDNDLLFL